MYTFIESFSAISAHLYNYKRKKMINNYIIAYTRDIWVLSLVVLFLLLLLMVVVVVWVMLDMIKKQN